MTDSIKHTVKACSKAIMPCINVTQCLQLFRVIHENITLKDMKLYSKNPSYGIYVNVTATYITDSIGVTQPLYVSFINFVTKGAC